MSANLAYRQSLSHSASFQSAKGAAQSKPRATPWVWDHDKKNSRALQGRPNPCHNHWPASTST